MCARGQGGNLLVTCVTTHTWEREDAKRKNSNLFTMFSRNYFPGFYDNRKAARGPELREMLGPNRIVRLIAFTRSG